MENSPQMGFDSKEVGKEELLNTSNDSTEKIFVNSDSAETKEIMKKMTEAYQLKLNTLGQHMNDLYVKFIESTDENEKDVIEKEFNSIRDQLGKIAPLFEQLRGHTYKEEGPESLN